MPFGKMCYRGMQLNKMCNASVLLILTKIARMVFSSKRVHKAKTAKDGVQKLSNFNKRTFIDIIADNYLPLMKRHSPLSGDSVSHIPHHNQPPFSQNTL